MPWVRFDDQFSIHRKIERLSDGAYRLYTYAIIWSARELTDGVISTDELLDAAPRRMRDPEQHLPELTDSGLWEEIPGGWVVHDFLDYQPSRERVLAERARNAERQRRFRESRTPSPRTADRRHAVTSETRNGVTDSVTNTAPSRPDPSRPEDSLRSSSPSPGEEWFEVFYAAYPRRVGRKAAEKAWAKALKGGAEPAELVAAAERFATEREGADPRYTPHPATWLNQGRWSDDPQPRTPATSGHQSFRNPDSPDVYHEDLL